MAKTGRPALDALDRQLVRLLEQRCTELGAAEGTCPVESVAEAQQSAARIVADAQIEDEKVADAIQEIMRHVVGQTMATRTRVRTSYLGPPYSYSHLAAIKYFGETSQLIPLASISAVFESILRHDCQTGVVPIENSTDGRIVDTLGMFLKHRVHICGEILLPIHHNLLSRTPLEQINEVYSKPQALSQCRNWLAQHLPAARLIEMSSTTAAAQLAAESPGAAAIASSEAAARYGLETLAASIEDNRQNMTRFAILGSTPTAPTGNDKTALLIQVPHEPGALADVMNLFKRAKLNLTWIESFPLPGSLSEYLFFVELEGHQQDPSVAQTIKRLARRTKRLEILGSYAKGTVQR